jgi:hypothetical protein
VIELGQALSCLLQPLGQLLGAGRGMTAQRCHFTLSAQRLAVGAGAPK